MKSIEKMKQKGGSLIRLTKSVRLVRLRKRMEDTITNIRIKIGDNTTDN